MTHPSVVRAARSGRALISYGAKSRAFKLKNGSVWEAAVVAKTWPDPAVCLETICGDDGQSLSVGESMGRESERKGVLPGTWYRSERPHLSAPAHAMSICTLFYSDYYATYCTSYSYLWL